MPNIVVRRHIFETNSSSVHSLVICSDKEFAGFENETSFISRWYDTMMTLEALEEKCRDSDPRWNEYSQKEKEDKLAEAKAKEGLYSQSEIINNLGWDILTKKIPEASSVAISLSGYDG